MRLSQILTFVALGLAVAVGQVLLKIAADQIVVDKAGPLWLRAASNPYLISASVIYLAAMVAWVWILSGMHLSRAYPFVVLGFIFTPVLALVFLREPITWGYLVGLVLVIAGLYFVQQH